MGGFFVKECTKGHICERSNFVHFSLVDVYCIHMHIQHMGSNIPPRQQCSTEDSKQQETKNKIQHLQHRAPTIRIRIKKRNALIAPI